ncbi:MAG: hypothetical protein H0X29_06795 [Parachlamydiaceae bacterium]|nr:hypothetical protein [Parachlamydiaceae bacterium]
MNLGNVSELQLIIDKYQQASDRPMQRHSFLENARKKWLAESKSVKDNIESFLLEFNRLKDLGNSQVPLSEKGNLFVLLGKKSTVIAQIASIIDLSNINKIAKFALGVIFCAYSYDVFLWRKEGERTGVYTPSYPEGDPLLMMSNNEKMVFISAILAMSASVLTFGPLVGKKIHRIQLENVIRNDSQFVDFVKKSQIKFTNQKEAEETVALFKTSQDIAKAVSTLIKSKPDF